ncbi:hypothetical protein DFQ27_003337 [Actinomortierella ambigua]|uniref:Major facilitator superfamily (MFS) profile domain-containing protein n=1 Tax=Actinomortierella ambigua TaxID=1343610 RepID=A0A9P6U5R8_9FUNG|nr:hypothetical protein DFQ27_003337 [Actinomortierella ambigua]
MILSVLIQAFCMSFEIQITYGIAGYVNAYFQTTSLQAVLPTIQAVISTSLVPLYTKVSDVFGRAPSLTFAFLCYLVGLTIEGSARSFEHFAIGQIVYSLGSTGIQALSQVVIADTTSLLTRGIMFAMYDVGTIANIWISQALIDPMTLGGAPDKWRISYIATGCVTGFGALALMLPLWYVQVQLRRRNVAQVPHKNLRWLTEEFDIPGAVLLTAALAFVCLPLTLAKRVEGNWSSPLIISMLCLGVICFVVLFFWETRWARRPILSVKVWTNRTAFGSLMVIFMLKFMGNVSWQYLTQYFVVSRDLTFGNATWLVRGYHLGWLVFQLIAAFLLKRYKRARLMVWGGVSLYTLGIGLMIPARHRTASSAFIVVAQVLGGAGAGFAHLACSVLVTGVVHRRDIASVVGATQILVWFGYAIGGAVSGAIWTQYLPNRLQAHVTGPLDETKAMNDPLKYVKNLPTETRMQVIEAYSDSIKLMSIVGLASALLTLLCTSMLQHVDLDQDQDAQDLIAMGEDALAEKADDEVLETKK